MHKKLNNDVSLKLKDKATDFKGKMGVVLELGNPSMKDRHWEKIFDKLGQQWYPSVPNTSTVFISGNFGILSN